MDTISGYPVLRANGSLESNHGLCRMFVGTADDIAFLVTDGDQASPSNGPNCDRSDRATTFALETMTEAG